MPLKRYGLRWLQNSPCCDLEDVGGERGSGDAVRALGCQELMLHFLSDAGKGVGTVFETLVVDTDAPLTEQLVRVALEAVHHQLPILRTKLQQRPEPWLLTSREAVQLDVLPAGDSWLHHQERIANGVAVNTTTGPLWKAHLLTGPTGLPGDPPEDGMCRAVVFLAFCHAVMDGMSAVEITRRLLEALDCLLRGEPLERKQPELFPDSAETMYCRNGLSLLPGMSYQMKSLKVLVGSIVNYLLGRTLNSWLTRPFSRRVEYRNRLMSGWLPASSTQQLVALCGQHGVRVNSALSAAVTLAAARLAAARRPGSFGLPCPVRCVWMVDMRRYLDSSRCPVDPASLVLCCVSAVYRRVLVQSLRTDEFWPLAKSIDYQIKQAIDHKEPLYNSLGTRLCRRAWAFVFKQPSVDVIINNRGNLDLKISSFQSIKLKQYHLLLQMSPLVSYQSFAVNGFTTVDGALFYDQAYISGQTSDEDASAYSVLVASILGEITGADSHQTDG